MDKTDRIINNGMAYVWLGLSIICICGVIFKGAWWHLFTAAISFGMYKMIFIPKEKTSSKPNSL